MIYREQQRPQSKSATPSSLCPYDAPDPPDVEALTPKKKRSRLNKYNQQMSLFHLEMEVDTIASLVELLTKHVQAAMGVNLIENSIEYLQENLKSGSIGIMEFEKVCKDSILKGSDSLCSCVGIWELGLIILY
jgi:hypothetical protein